MRFRRNSFLLKYLDLLLTSVVLRFGQLKLFAKSLALLGVGLQLDVQLVIHANLRAHLHLLHLFF